MKESLNIEQGQQTVQRLSPRQVQFVRLLEMNGPELEDEVKRQLDDNPALEIADPDETDDTIRDNDNDEESAYDDTIDADPDDDPADYNSFRRADKDDAFTPQIADDNTDLYGFLLDQLGQIEMSEICMYIAQYIIGNIDENGYLTRLLSEMCDDIIISTGLEVTSSQMKEAYDVVRSLDPPGVGAVDLRDCLLIQLKRISHPTPISVIATDIIEHNFDLLSKKHYDRLQAQLNVDASEMRKALGLIRTLNPKPGSGIAPSQTMIRQGHITSDVTVEFIDGEHVSISLASNIPRLQIERTFEIEPDTDANSSEAVASAMKQAQAFIRLKREEAESFISALRQRSNTLLTVTEAIVRLQHDFFMSGDLSKLRPMILKDVSNITGLDISVISRATASKYVSTANGVYPLKMFFNEASHDDADTSTHKILHDLQDIIDKEDKRHPLSDEALKDALETKGYKLARRTVTKYREKLGLPVGRLRKSI